ncbi:MAG: hypothetical protein FWG37_03740, partial [Clostridia bacterium]|nr:hypothetical protein [Clostridia bacterium]
MRVLRLALFVFVLLSTACLLYASNAIPAGAESVLYGDTTYIYPAHQERDTASAAFVIGMRYVSVDMDTFEQIIDPMQPGAVFGVYAKGNGGEFVPFPDPKNPFTPWRIPVGEQPVTVLMPRSVDLYIKQEFAPDGYLTDEAGYRLLSIPQSLTITNYRSGIQGIQIRLIGRGAEGPVPLPDVRFSMENGGSSHSPVTDQHGLITLLSIAAGEYVLRQETEHEGYHIETPEIAVTVQENRASRVDVANNRGGVLSVNPIGIIAVGAEFEEQVIPLEGRIYEVLDETGLSHGFLSYGQRLSLPTAAGGTVYLLRQIETPNDGFAADQSGYAVVLHAGETVVKEPTVMSATGFFMLSVVSDEDETPVDDGIFTVYNDKGTAVSTFKLEEGGTYLPKTPIIPGVYTLRCASAPSGFLYSDKTVRFEIRPYLTDLRPITEIEYRAKPIPRVLKEPVVICEPKRFASVFEESVQFDFTLELKDADAFPLPISELTFDISMPKDPTIRPVREHAGGARVDVLQRFAVPGVRSLDALTVTGEVRYTFTYLSAANTFAEASVNAPFSVVVATFEPPENPVEYIKYGRVRDGTGNPAEGVRVSLEDSSGAYVFAEIQTDPN